MDRRELLDVLLSLLPAQFELLRARLGVPSALLPSSSQAQRAVALLQYQSQPGRSLHDVERALGDVMPRPRTAAQNEVLDRLKTRLPGDFEILRLRLGVPDSLLAGSQITRGTQLIEYLESRGELSRLTAALDLADRSITMPAPESLSWLSHDDVLTVHAAAIEADLSESRSVLFSGMRSDFVGSLPKLSSPSSQLLSDLNKINGVVLDGGTVPLRQWLQAAVLIAGPRKQASVFRHFLEKLEPLGSAEPEDPQPPEKTIFQGEGHRVMIVSHEEESALVKAFMRHLRPMERDGTLSLCEAPFQDNLAEAPARYTQGLQEAQLVVLCLSPALLSSEAAFDLSRRAVARDHEDNLRVTLIMFSSCRYESLGVSGHSILPSPTSSIETSGSAIQQIFLNMSESILQIAQDYDVHQIEDAHPISELGGTPIGHIFKISGRLEYTYVEPYQFKEIKSHLQIPGEGLLVEGPSQIGKSTAVFRALNELGVPYERIRSRVPPELAKLDGILDSWVVEGHVVIDDAHRLSRGTLDKLAMMIRTMADDDDPKGKITLIGINQTNRSLVQGHRDLAGRIHTVPMGRQPDEKIRALILKGERAANLDFARKPEFISEARGSLRLAQQLCKQAALESGHEEVPKVVTQIKLTPEHIRERVMRELRTQFQDAFQEFAGADRGREPRGACLALLSAVTNAGDHQVLFGTVRHRYPELDASFEFIANGLETKVATSPELAELIYCDKGLLTIQDPQALYFLDNLDWKLFAEGLGVHVELGQQGRLVFLNTHLPFDAPNNHFLDKPPYPWANPKARELVELLCGAYSTAHGIQSLVRRVGLDEGAINYNLSTKEIWRQVAEGATNAARMRELLDLVLKDPTVAGYHATIERTLGRGWQIDDDAEG